MENMQTQSVPQEAPRAPKKRGKGLWIIIIIILAVLAYFAWSTGMVGGKVAAVVDGEKITERELMKRFEQNKQAILVQNPSIDFENEANHNALLAQTLDQLINEILVFRAADERGVGVSRSELNDQIDIIESRFDSKEAFEAELEKGNLTASVFRENVERELLVRAYVEDLAADNNVTVTDEEVETAYNNALAQDSTIPALEEVRDQVVDALRAQKLEVLLGTELTTLRNDADIEVIINIETPEVNQNTQEAISDTTSVDTGDTTVDEGTDEDAADDADASDESADTEE